FGDFERIYGGLDSQSEASYAIQQFFLNGGSEAWLVRTAQGNPTPADVRIGNATSGAAVLTVIANSPGSWGETLRVRVDSLPTAGQFNLTLTEYDTKGGSIVVR